MNNTPGNGEEMDFMGGKQTFLGALKQLSGAY
jgi:hypothetical protein